MRVYTISTSHPNIRRLLIVIAVISHILIILFLVIGFEEFMRTFNAVSLTHNSLHSPATVRYNADIGVCAAKVNWPLGAMYTVPVSLTGSQWKGVSDGWLSFGLDVYRNCRIPGDNLPCYMLQQDQGNLITYSDCVYPSHVIL